MIAIEGLVRSSSVTVVMEARALRSCAMAVAASMGSAVSVGVAVMASDARSWLVSPGEAMDWGKRRKKVTVIGDTEQRLRPTVTGLTVASNSTNQMECTRSQGVRSMRTGLQLAV